MSPDGWQAFEGVTRLVAGGFLTVAGIWKVNSTWAWRQVWLTSYELLPTSLVAPVALLLPVVELTCGSAVLLGALDPVASWAAIGLYGSFAMAVAKAKVSGLEVPCGCIPWLERMVSWRVVARNLALVAALAAVAAHGLSGPSLSASGVDWWAQVGMTAGSVGVVLFAIEVVQGWRRRRVIAALIAAATPS